MVLETPRKISSRLLEFIKSGRKNKSDKLSIFVVRPDELTKEKFGIRRLWPNLNAAVAN